ncbi:putative endolysin [Sinorhizobium phage phiM6]|nr:putative endolysin [Sinorhizobium phage phiM6]
MTTRLKKAGKFTTIGAAAIALIGVWEGVRTTAYRDIVGIPTVCFGETRGVKMGDKYTLAECKEMLGDAVIEFEQGIRKCLKSPDKIPDEVYVTSLSLSYNIGQSAFCKSTVARRLNEGNFRAACNAISLFNKAGGKVSKGLINRRAEEKKICLEGLK